MEQTVPLQVNPDQILAEMRGNRSVITVCRDGATSRITVTWDVFSGRNLPGCLSRHMACPMFSIHFPELIFTGDRQLA